MDTRLLNKNTIETIDAHFFCVGCNGGGGAGGNVGDGGSDGRKRFENYDIVVVGINLHRLVAGVSRVLELGDPCAQLRDLKTFK